MSEIYKVTIEVVRTEEVITPKSWERIREDTSKDNGYGYTPQVIETKDVERQIFKYQAAELNVPEVIQAVLENSKAV